MEANSNSAKFATVLILGIIGLYAWSFIRNEPTGPPIKTTLQGTVIDGPRGNPLGITRLPSIIEFKVRLANGKIIRARPIGAMAHEYRGPVEVTLSKGEWTDEVIYRIRVIPERQVSDGV